MGDREVGKRDIRELDARYVERAEGVVCRAIGVPEGTPLRLGRAVVTHELVAQIALALEEAEGTPGTAVDRSELRRLGERMDADADAGDLRSQWARMMRVGRLRESGDG